MFRTYCACGKPGRFKSHGVYWCPRHEPIRIELRNDIRKLERKIVKHAVLYAREDQNHGRTIELTVNEMLALKQTLRELPRVIEASEEDDWSKDEIPEEDDDE